MEDYKFLKSSTEVSIEVQDDGFYKCIQTLSNSRSTDGKEWEDRKISVKSYNQDVDKALSTLIVAMDSFLKDYQYNLFNIPEEKYATLTPQDKKY